MALSVSIELVSSSARVTSVKSQQGVGLTDGHAGPKIGSQVYLGPIKTGWFFTGSAPYNAAWFILGGGEGSASCKLPSSTTISCTTTIPEPINTMETKFVSIYSI